MDDRLRALILKRSLDEKEGPGLWTIPGGKVKELDLGEPQTFGATPQWRWFLERALVREVYEETGIWARPQEFLPLHGGVLIFTRNDGTPTLCTTHYLIHISTQEIRLGKGATEYAWVGYDELDRYQFIGDVARDIRVAMRECEERS